MSWTLHEFMSHVIKQKITWCDFTFYHKYNESDIDGVILTNEIQKFTI